MRHRLPAGTAPRGGIRISNLYCGVGVAVLYVLMYLFVMDPLGLHFYHILLSPRPHWCWLLYLMTLGLFPLFLWVWNGLVESMGYV